MDPVEESRVVEKCSDPIKGSVPGMDVSYCLGSEENGVRWGRGVRVGVGRQKGGKISSRCPTKAGTTWRRMRRNNEVGHDEGGSAQTE
jgi:hypothetical protein